mmetsp:Transcript_35575/g.77571  ORF Transcript_35575/g.77571 Transcript_35575/m.77571 type:complete len:236 (-) Transcript_35575:192-899(-)
MKEHLWSHVRNAAVDLLLPVSIVRIYLRRHLGLQSVPHANAHSNTEVRQLELSARGLVGFQEEVLRLHVAVHYTHGVTMRECAEHLLPKDPSTTLLEVTLPGDEAKEVAALAILHQQEDMLLVLVCLIEANDAWMVEFAQHLDLFPQRVGLGFHLVEHLASVVLLAALVLDRNDSAVSALAHDVKHVVITVRVRQLPVPRLHEHLLGSPWKRRLRVHLVGTLKRRGVQGGGQRRR